MLPCFFLVQNSVNQAKNETLTNPFEQGFMILSTKWDGFCRSEGVAKLKILLLMCEKKKYFEKKALQLIHFNVILCRHILISSIFKHLNKKINKC